MFKIITNAATHSIYAHARFATGSRVHCFCLPLRPKNAVFTSLHPIQKNNLQSGKCGISLL